MGRSARDRTVTLRYLMAVERGGKVYRYLRRRGQPLVALPDLPTDHPDFLAAYAAALKVVLAPQARSAPGTMGALLDAALSSEAFLAFRPGYRAILRREADAIRASTGTLPFRGLRSRHIKSDVSRASQPSARHKAWRFACTWALEAELLKEDPTEGMKAPRRAETSGHPPWTADEIRRYRARWPIGTVARAAMELLHWTGVRISDAVLIGPQHVDRDGVLIFRQTKTGDLAYVPWTCPLLAYAAELAGDREIMHLAIAPLSGQLTFLATGKGQARTRSAKALGTLIQKAAAAAEVEKSAHGLRKARAVALAEGGATTHQIAAWTGHKSLKEVEHYTQAASRRRGVLGVEAVRPSKRTR